MAAPIALAALGRSGWVFGSVFSMNFFLPMRMRKPGVAPFGLPLSMSQPPGAAAAPSSISFSAHAPRKSSSRVGLRAPRRFVNQALSGTSSSALTFGAGPAGSTAKTRARGRNTELSTASHTSGDTYGSGAHATCFGSSSLGRSSHSTRTGRWSVSFAIGARRGNRGWLAHAESKSATPAERSE